MSPAQISEYRKIEPTKCTINATRPCVLSLAESFDPFCRAHIQGSKIGDRGVDVKPIPQYSLINGFYTDKKGDYIISIEYEPQQLLVKCGIISVIAIIGFFGIYLISIECSNLILIRS